MSLDAYKKTQTSVEDPRQSEYRLFTEVTRALMDARDNGDKGQGFFSALDWNRRMWSTLSTDCGIEGNGLPDQLRAGIISLSIWVSKHSSAVAKGEESIEDLIKINRTVMEGLATMPVEATPAPTPTPTQMVDGSAKDTNHNESQNTSVVGQAGVRAEA